MTAAIACDQVSFGPVVEHRVDSFISRKNAHIDKVHCLGISFGASLLSLRLEIAVLESSCEIISIAIVAALKED